MSCLLGGVLPCRQPHHTGSRAPFAEWPTTCVAGRATAVAMEANSRADNSLCVTGAVEQGGEGEERGRKKKNPSHAHTHVHASRHTCAA